MALNQRLSVYENIPLRGNMNVGGLVGANYIHMKGVVIPGSISFNNLALVLSKSAGSSMSISLSFGLYSLTGSTLSLANSASMSSAFGTQSVGFVWRTLETSAAQDITPGNWYYGLISETSNDSRAFIVCYDAQGNSGAFGGGNSGVFVRGIYSTTTNALPSSINTSEMIKEYASGGVNTGSLRTHYILIAA